jgi:nucleoid DNA-binding protein
MTRVPAHTLGTKDFVNVFYERVSHRDLGLTKRTCKAVYDAFVESLIDATNDGFRVRLTNFGEFYPVIRAAKKGRNPRTGAPVDIPPKRNVAFRLSSKYYQELQDTQEGWNRICEQIFAEVDDAEWEDGDALP